FTMSPRIEKVATTGIGPSDCAKAGAVSARAKMAAADVRSGLRASTETSYQAWRQRRGKARAARRPASPFLGDSTLARPATGMIGCPGGQTEMAEDKEAAMREAGAERQQPG
ncbi:MAG: hypothetical protein OXI33_11680, partial [Chloroflexota bacterium]|nr:hypothetical protein [Chloroflexota bacterium]